MGDLRWPSTCCPLLQLRTQVGRSLNGAKYSGVRTQGAGFVVSSLRNFSCVKPRTPHCAPGASASGITTWSMQTCPVSARLQLSSVLVLIPTAHLRILRPRRQTLHVWAIMSAPKHKKMRHLALLEWWFFFFSFSASSLEARWPVEQPLTPCAVASVNLARTACRDWLLRISAQFLFSMAPVQ